MGKTIVGNWKMNGSATVVDSLVGALVSEVPAAAFESGGLVAVSPPMPYLARAAQLLTDSPITLAAQNVHPAMQGAFTGESSLPMMLDLGVSLCIVGHSERRQMFGESDGFIGEKVAAVLASGLRPILCVGETLAQREAGTQEAVVWGQITAGTTGVAADDFAKLLIAYEPVWAIGTGAAATPKQAGEIHSFIRQRLRSHCPHQAPEVRLLYGGSVHEKNAGEILQVPDIDGVLIGGASLKAPSFLEIVRQSIVTQALT